MAKMSLAWYLLYKEEYDEVPDINKPENVAWLNAKKKERVEDFKKLMSGPGKVLFKEWEKKIRENNLSLFAIPDGQLCECTACRIIRDMQSMFRLWVEAETIINQGD